MKQPVFALTLASVTKGQKFAYYPERAIRADFIESKMKIQESKGIQGLGGPGFPAKGL
jgi:hypothetical protein